ncbi:WD40 repeat-like protein [Paxillus ammoniavirescens]|nr:WD40 repeat-like protein [Paxillus ammoniavirescens]
MQGHTDWIWSLASIPDSDLVVSGSGDRSCRVWNAKDGDEVYAMRYPGTERWWGAEEKTVNLSCGAWGAERRSSSGTLRKAGSTPSQCRCSQDSKIVASGHGNGTIRPWNASAGGRIAGPYQLLDGRVRRSLRWMTLKLPVHCSDGHMHVIYVLTSTVTLPFQVHDWWIQITSLVAEQPTHLIRGQDGLELSINHNYTGSLNTLAISSDGLSMWGRNRYWHLQWETVTYKPLGSAILHRTPLVAVALCSDGLYLAAAGKDRKVYIWTLKDIQEVA